MDVFPKMRELGFTAHDVVIGFVLPELACLFSCLIDGSSRKGFPTMQDFFEFMFSKRRQQDMDMVGHYDPFIQLIAFCIEVA